MYPPNQQKPMLVRPRSSLSTAAQDIERNRSDCCAKSFTTCETALCGCCLILLIFNGILVSAIVLIGKTLVNSNSTSLFSLSYFDQNNTVIPFYRNDNNNDNSYDNDDHSIRLKPKIIFKLTQDDIKNIHNPQGATNSGGLNAPNFNTSNNMSKTAGVIVNKEQSDKQSEALKMSKVLNKLNFRLPREIKPINYELLLHPNLKEKTFSGDVSILVNISKPINYIPVHSKLLSITESTVHRIDSDGSPTPMNIINKFLYEPNEYWVLEFNQDLYIGQYLIGLKFNGSLTNRIVGFYQSSYFDKTKNETRVIATSKFEPTYARQAFPCFDEPDMKANFSVSIIRPTGDNYHALSNMNIKEEKEYEEKGLTKTTFENSVKMSTYLACFIVSDFKEKHDIIETKGIGENFDLRVFATPAQLDKVDYALEVGKKITEYYIQYFQIPYPLPKLDMAAIPDFVSGAMEHWGLVTFRETSLLYDPKISSTANKERVGSVVAHELAHMWFGNLVTMKWWNDLWLNEGFASYIQYKGLDHAHKDWKMLDQFLIDGFQSVLQLDATLASHPIVQKVENPDQITELFDKITYQKGAAIIRMLEDFVGADKFQLAVTNYLKKFQYNNAETKDLLEQIAAINTDIDVEEIMQTWTVQMGFPVVNVEQISETEFKLKQKRFFANPEDENKEHEQSPYHYRWEIHLTYFTNDKEEVLRKWFKHEDAEVTIKVDAGTKWIKFNKDQVGYYRVNYSNEMWTRLIEALKSNINVFSVSDRAHLLNDAFSLSDAGQLGYNTSLELTKYLNKETEYVPWDVAANQLKKIAGLLKLTPANDPLVQYLRNLIDPVYKSIDWENNEGHLNNLFRITIIDFACKFGHSDCLNKVESLFVSWINDKTDVTPDFKGIVYKYGMQKAGTEELWDKVWDMYKKESDAGEKLKLMASLTAIEKPEIINKLINLAWDEQNVRGQDYFSVLQSISANSVGEAIVWDYVRDNWEKLVKRFGLNERYLGNMVPSITSRFSTQTKLKEMKTFFNDNPEAGAGASARKQAIANVEVNIKWLTQNEEQISKWLNKDGNVLI